MDKNLKIITIIQNYQNYSQNKSRISQKHLLCVGTHGMISTLRTSFQTVELAWTVINTVYLFSHAEGKKAIGAFEQI